jgi:hypothetical protein
MPDHVKKKKEHHKVSVQSMPKNIVMLMRFCAMRNKIRLNAADDKQRMIVMQSSRNAMHGRRLWTSRENDGEERC